MDALRPAKAFADYRDIEPRKGANWVPIPSAMRSARRQ